MTTLILKVLHQDKWFLTEMVFNTGSTDKRNLHYTLPNDATLRHQYFRYRHQTNTTVFTILSNIKWTKFPCSSTIISKVSLFAYVIQPMHTASSVHEHSKMSQLGQ